MEQLPPGGPPARRRGRAARAARRPRSPSPTAARWLDAQLVALETQAAALAGDAAAVPRPRRALLRLPRRRAGPTPSSRRPRRGSTSCSRATARWPSGSRRWDRALRDPGRSAAGRRRLARRRGSGRARPALFGLPDGEDLRVSLVDRPAVVRLQLVRRRPPLAGRHQHGPAGPGAGPRRHASPTRPIPGHHLEHAWKEADLVDGAGPARGVDPADQHARVPDQRGPRRPRAVGSRVPDDERVDLLVELFERAGLADRRRPGRGARRRRAGRRADRAAREALVGDPRQRRAPAPRRRPVARRGPRLPPRRRPATRRRSRPSASSSSSTRSGGPTSSSTPRARRCSAAGSRRSRADERAARFGRLLHEQLTPGDAVTAVPAERPTRSSPSPS